LSDRRTNFATIPPRNFSQISTATAHAPRTCILRCRPRSIAALLYDLQPVSANAKPSIAKNQKNLL
jgi:hypothetical protein